LYINDIIKTVPASTVYTYADDTTLIITSSSMDALQELAQSELTNLIRYFHDNNLVPNATKTQFSVFQPHTQNICPVLRVNGVALEQVTSAKLLGLMFQDDMKHHQTIINIVKKLQPTIYKLRFANKLLDTHRMKNIYYSLIFPHLIGGITVWGTAEEATYMQPLIKTHKKIIRLIYNRPPRTHSRPLMNTLGILTLTNLYIWRVCIEMHPFMHPRKPLNRPEHNHNYIWTCEVHEYPTRYSLQGHNYITNPAAHRYSKTKTPTYSMHSSTVRNSKIWNTIPQDIREMRGLDPFTAKLRKHLLAQQTETHRSSSSR
jgi:hypothetical protein